MAETDPKKISGKNLKFYFGDKGAAWDDTKKVGLRSVSLSSNGSEIDVTDSETSGDGKEMVSSRSNHQLKLEGILKDSAGSKMVGKEATLSFDTTPYSLIDFDYQHNGDNLDVTDTGTPGDGFEFLAGRVGRASKITLWALSTDAHPVRSNTAKACVLTLKSGENITGTAKILNVDEGVEVNGAMKYTLSISWVTATVNIAKVPPFGVEKDWKILYFTGTTTDKATEGKGIINQWSISGSYNSEIKYTGTIDVNGEPNKTQAN